MLPKAHRLRRSAEFGFVVRRGRRATSKTLVVHLAPSQVPERGLTVIAPPKVGFVVSKAVGNAVQRNRVKRQLRHAVRTRLAEAAGQSIVIRANPAAESASYAQLVADLDRCLTRVNDGAP